MRHYFYAGGHFPDCGGHVLGIELLFGEGAREGKSGIVESQCRDQFLQRLAAVAQAIFDAGRQFR